MIMKDRTIRLAYAGASLLLFAAEALIALFVHDGFIRPYFGDVLVVILIYCVIRIFMPRKPKWLICAVFIFAVLVEFSQMIPLVELIGLGGSALMRTLMGTSFSWADIVCYAAGCAAVAVFETPIKKIYPSKHR